MKMLSCGLAAVEVDKSMVIPALVFHAADRTRILEALVGHDRASLGRFLTVLAEADAGVGALSATLERTCDVDEVSVAEHVRRFHRVT